MATTAYASSGRVRRGRSLPTAGALQWATWSVVVALILGPFVPLLYASLRDRPLYQAGGVLTLAAYRQLFGDPAFWRAVVHTLEYAGLTTALSVLGGGAVAVIVARTDLPNRRQQGRKTQQPQQQL